LYGFTIIYNNTSDFSIENSKSISYQNHSFFYKQSSKFLNDKIFTETPDFIIGIDGVILNLFQLKKQHNLLDYTALIIHLFDLDKQFFMQFKGDFSGFIFNKNTEELICFTNHVGSQKLFYSQLGNSTIISHRLETVTQFRKDNRLNIAAAYELMTFGGMIENKTLVTDVYRLLGGEQLTVTPTSFKVSKYFDFNTIQATDKSSKKAIQKLDELFTDLITLEYEKDKEYGYEHFATLSGGLDSRMNVMAANKMGYQTHNFCFSQSNYDDHKIAEQISKDLNNKFSFISLDNADYLTQLEENLEIYDGLIFYLASAHYNYTLNKLDIKNAGVIHTGQIGDAILGGFVSLGKPNYFSSMMSRKLEHKLTPINTSKYASEETFKLYNRLFNVTTAGCYVSSHHQSYLVAPFLDPEFISLCLSLHPSLKKEGKIYFEWINKLRPEVANYKWEKTGFRPDALWKNKLSQYTKKIKKTYFAATNQQHKTSMNPYDYWYNNNKEVASFFENHFKNNIACIENTELNKDATSLFEIGNTIEKSMVITLLSAIKKLNLTT
jgi:asparagine synthase (glutamine-hydrolysing)